jgi:hypothetical protein
MSHKKRSCVNGACFVATSFNKSSRVLRGNVISIILVFLYVPSASKRSSYNGGKVRTAFFPINFFIASTTSIYFSTIYIGGLNVYIKAINSYFNCSARIA